jgi:hypothetical protein
MIVMACIPRVQLAVVLAVIVSLGLFLVTFGFDFMPFNSRVAPFGFMLFVGVSMAVPMIAIVVMIVIAVGECIWREAQGHRRA